MIFKKWVSAAAIGVGAILVGVSAQAGAQYKLRWAHYLPNSDFLAIEKAFAEAVETRSDGRVDIEIVYSEGLGKGNEVLTLAGRGAVDMASGVPGYYADQLPFWRAYQLPFVFDSTAQAVRVSTAAYKALPLFQEELDRMGVTFLMHQPLGSYYLTGKTPDCASVDGLNGKKLRSFGADVPRAHNAIGGVPVTVSTTEIYEALERGTLDYSFLSRGNIASNRWYEVAGYNCGPVMSIAGHIIVIGQRSLARLPQDIQTILFEEAEKAQAAYIAWSESYEQDAQRAIEAGGAEFLDIPAAEMSRWKATAPDFLADWAQQMEALGRGEDAAEVAALWRDLIAADRAQTN